MHRLAYIMLQRLMLAVFLVASVSHHVSGKHVFKQSVAASCFNHGSGKFKSNLNDGGFYFAELSNGYALNGLDPFHRLRISYGGKSVIASKADIGSASSVTIDVHIRAAKALGFSTCRRFGIKSVTIESV